MRWENIHIAAVGTWLPEPVAVEAAVRSGELTPERCEVFGYRSVLVAPEGVAPPDMAVHAAETALKRSGVAPEEFGLLLHGSLWFQGLDVWPVGSYIAQRTVGRTVPALDVQQRCNIGVGGIELAASHLAARARGSAVMLTTADRWDGPGVDRWSLHEDHVYGDGATAMVLSRHGGFARLLSTATVADNSLEAMARGDEPFHPVSPAAHTPLDLTRRSRQYKDGHDEDEAALRHARVMLQAKVKALAAARMPSSGLARVVVPATGRRKGDYQLHHLLGVEERQTTWAYGRTTGHIGGGDLAAGLAHLVETDGVRPGDRVLLFGGGSGFTCTTAVLEITEVPRWT